ncbi:MAG: SDR family oxidoreductase [bacterium]|nr:SDR family oxidoreductase [bacterium]
MIDLQLAGKTAVITGANNPMGIGAGIARALAAQGAAVLLTYRQGESAPPPPDETGGMALYAWHNSLNADTVVAQIAGAGGKVRASPFDLTDPAGFGALFDQAEAAFGGVDILINNAAHSAADTFLPAPELLVNRGSVAWLESNVPTLTAASHDAHFAVNTRAPALLMVEFARRYIERGAGWGRIVNLTTDGSPGFPSEIAYGASKHALESYTRAAALELGQFGITVNAVSPGPTQTGWMTPAMQEEAARVTPLRRTGTADDIADAVMFLCSHQARWITGQILHVNGGHRV